eukprot:scaffold116144_cov36-Phaeocystis_antarctica.AAC.1
MQHEERRLQLGRVGERRGLLGARLDLWLVDPAAHKCVVVVPHLGVSLLAEPVGDASARDAARKHVLGARRRQCPQREVTAPRVPSDGHAAPRVDAVEGPQEARTCHAVGEVSDAAAVAEDRVHEGDAEAGRTSKVGDADEVTERRQPGHGENGYVSTAGRLNLRRPELFR